MGWRDFVKKRPVVYGAGSVAAVLLVVGSLILAALLAERYPLRWDTTPGKSQSLSAATRALLAEVDKPLTITVFYREGIAERQNARNLLERYTYNNRQISYRLVDPEREPLVARQAGVRYQGNVLLDYQGRRQMVDRPEEEAITNALRQVLKPGRRQIYFLTGHGERDLQDQEPDGFQVARRALENEGYEVKGLNLLSTPEVPQEAAVVIVASPTKPLLGSEVAGLKAYLAQGGRLLVMLEAFKNGGLKDFLGSYGVELNEGIILDANQVSQALSASMVTPLVVQYGPHRITRDFKNLVTIFPLARPLTLKQGVKGVAWLPLATTMATSWERLGKEGLKEAKAAFDPARDRKGPFTLAALGEISLEAKKPQKAKDQPPVKRSAEESKTYMVVFGDVDFADNAYFNLFGNGDLFLNTVNFLAGEEKQIIIRQDRKPHPLTLTPTQIWTLFFTSLVVFPLAMLIAGIWAYRRRRARR